MIELPYSLVIEATEEPDYFGFYSPDLEGFSGIGHSVEDCLYKANPTTIHKVIPSTQQVFVSDERDKLDDSSSVSMIQAQ